MVTVTDFGRNEEHGFFWIEIDGNLTVQVCLEKNAPISINAGDCGHDLGICGDVNEAAFQKYGIAACLDALFDKAKENGIIVIV